MLRYHVTICGIISVLMIAIAVASTSARADEKTEAKLRLMEQTLEDLLARDAEKDRIISELQQQIQDLRVGSRGDVEDIAASSEAGHEHGHGHAQAGGHDHGSEHEDEAGSPPDLYAVDLGDGSTLRLRGIGVNGAIAVGGSSEDGEALENLQGGGHDPIQNGFTLQTVDVGFLGAVDPYFDAEAHIAFFIDNEGETVVELEEAFMRTQPGTLPGGFEIEAGQMFTEFGAYNPEHFHDHTYLDQPVILSRLLGPDGSRGPGVRVGWDAPTPFGLKFHLGAQNANGETQPSFRSSDEAFEERPIGGREFMDRDVDGFEDLTYLARVATSFDVNSAAHLDIGASGLFGPNATGDDTQTYIAGVDVTLGHGFSDGTWLEWQSEFLYRHYEAAADLAEGFPEDTLEDYGFYTQLVYGFAPKWSAGLRYEYVTGSGESVGDFAGRDEDPFRSDRHRISPLLTWQFAPTGNLRLQYNYDSADHLDDDDAHTFWLGAQWSFGAGEAVHPVTGGLPHHDH